MLVGGSDEPAKQLKLIDAIQQLVVSYHFESEIDAALKNHMVNFDASFGKCNKINDDDDDDLYIVALRFRLLRQRGHHISFEQLKDEVRQMLMGGSDELAKQLKLIDAIQRLRVSYHFESEIDDALKNHVVNFNASFAKCYVPTMEEYMEVALVSAGYIMVATTSFVGMGELFEQKRGHVASAVECYMKQHTVTKEVAFVEFNKRISNAWKDMNQESFHPTAVPMALLERVLNLHAL
ncbi:hypothetical protein LguiA_033686 [Lonicera macranthoides]